jgi:hypothetical protein
MYEVFDLCLECKGCKAECPSNVDMAKLKYEFLAQYYARNGTPLRARLFGNLEALNRVGCACAPLSNWVANSAPARWLSERLLGIHRNRQLPPFARETFTRWFAQRNGRRGVSIAPGPAPSLGTRGPVVLFNDTYMTYNYPELGKAAVKVLEAAGFEVILADKKCCPPRSPGCSNRPMWTNSRYRNIGLGLGQLRSHLATVPRSGRRLPRGCQAEGSGFLLGLRAAPTSLRNRTATAEGLWLNPSLQITPGPGYGDWLRGRLFSAQGEMSLASFLPLPPSQKGLSRCPASLPLQIAPHGAGQAFDRC